MADNGSTPGAPGAKASTKGNALRPRTIVAVALSALAVSLVAVYGTVFVDFFLLGGSALWIGGLLWLVSCVFLLLLEPRSGTSAAVAWFTLLLAIFLSYEGGFTESYLRVLGDRVTATVADGPAPGVAPPAPIPGETIPRPKHHLLLPGGDVITEFTAHQGPVKAGDEVTVYRDPLGWLDPSPVPSVLTAASTGLALAGYWGLVVSMCWRSLANRRREHPDGTASAP
ncbi:hypothetical protein [Actinocorallia sp. A-T 12471]|uniref:hypothetical protein n=1 Tax=Actinocorallia sp. A-T 12471 TaxID=3089813 RepID=UPI0029CCC682|nr:hypothetical protein [Actinocorallia sp. A-T 12471]MDX6740012.1 hypothetical protein [Actinocorallia sp. A-T 12471]